MLLQRAAPLIACVQPNFSIILEFAGTETGLDASHTALRSSILGELISLSGKKVAINNKLCPTMVYAACACIKYQ
jgi:hypothetical protein